ncbi:hypothetical protein Mgra_00007198, partial [Meloidogyne graminicola]
MADNQLQLMQEQINVLQQHVEVLQQQNQAQQVQNQALIEEIRFIFAGLSVTQVISQLHGVTIEAAEDIK